MKKPLIKNGNLASWPKNFGKQILWPTANHSPHIKTDFEIEQPMTDCRGGKHVEGSARLEDEVHKVIFYGIYARISACMSSELPIFRELARY